MRIFFDTEFIDDGKTIDLISIGMIREDGEIYYAENSGCNYYKADPWVEQNVFPHLKGPQKTKEEIAQEIIEFVGPNPEFWAYFASYDWVVLCQLYGRMLDVPNGWPHFCLDLKQELYLRGLISSVKQPENAHNALADAIWAKDTFDSFLVYFC